MAAVTSALFPVLVSGLPASASEDSLRTVFSQHGPVQRVQVSPGATAQVFFSDRSHAEQAASALNRLVLDGCEIHVTADFPREDACVHIRDLPKDAREEHLRDLFSRFGTVISARVELGKGLNYGFVQFDLPEAAARAIAEGTAELLNTRIRVERFIPKTERKGPSSSIYVRGFDGGFTEQELKAAFAPYGDISSCTINKDQQSGARVYGFVNFVSKESADAALQLNGQVVGGIPWFVSPAANQSPAQYAHRPQNEDWSKRNIYIAGFPAHLTQTNIQKLCETFGEIESIRMQPRNGFEEDLNSAFVCFKREQDADAAIEALKNTLIERCKVKVSKWKPIESRRVFALPTNLMTQWPFGLPFGFYQPQMQQKYDRPSHYHRPRHYRPHTDNHNRQHPVPQSSTFDLGKYNSLSAGDKKRMIGEHIFYILNPTYQDSTGKITGMLLEMQQTELLALTQNSKALLDKAAEAMEVLRKHTQGK